jgi:uncharacterized membrane protein
LVAVDFLWLGVMMPGFYKTESGPLARRTGASLAPVNWAAVLVWLLIPLGIMLFVLPKVDAANLYWTALGWGFLYGAILYAVYDLTNYAMLERWSLKMTGVDILWGGILCGLGACMATFLNRIMSEIRLCRISDMIRTMRIIPIQWCWAVWKRCRTRRG